MPPKKKEVVKVQVAFTKKQMDIIRSYKDIFGSSDAEIVSYIVTNCLVQTRDPKSSDKNETYILFFFYFIYRPNFFIYFYFS